MHIHDYYLLRAKTVEQSTGPWDFYDVVATIRPKTPTFLANKVSVRS
jgi:hypothetical protein